MSNEVKMIERMAVNYSYFMSQGVVDFINIFMRSFYAKSSPKRKNSVKSSVSFYAFVIYACKSCT